MHFYQNALCLSKSQRNSTSYLAVSTLIKPKKGAVLAVVAYRARFDRQVEGRHGGSGGAGRRAVVRDSEGRVRLGGIHREIKSAAFS